MTTQDFLEWSKALGAPLLAIAVAFATYLLARWQVRIAREKLRHDLYDRRFAIYMAFHELLVAICEKDDAQMELRAANAARAQSPFLLEGLGEYLNELHKQAFRINAASQLLADPNFRSARSPAEIIKETEKLSGDKLAFVDRVPELASHFELFLRLKDFSTPVKRQRS